MENTVNEKGVIINTIEDPDNPGTFRVSEEEGKRLREMAMSSEGNMADYTDQIPDRVYNHICCDEANRNIEKYQQEAKEFTNNIVQDEATREILDEAEATTSLKAFDFGDIDEYCEKLSSLSFLEAVSFKKKIDVEIARWKSCKSMLKAVSELRVDDTVNKELMKINAMEKYDFLESIDEFESQYEENLGKLEKISSTLVSIVDSHKDEMESTRFLSNEMIHLMKVKIDKLNPSDMNYELNKRKMNIVVEAFENRLDLEYLTGKLSAYLLSSKTNIRRDLRTSKEHRRAKFLNDLARFFSEDILYALYERLSCAFTDDMKAVYVMMGFLAKIMNSEKKTSRDVWAKVFILNLSDIYNNIFDIEELGEGECSYLMRIRDAFYPKLKEFLESQKDIKINNWEINFGVKTPSTKKKSDEISEYSAIPATIDEDDSTQSNDN